MNSNNPVLSRGFGQGQGYATFGQPAPAAADLQDMYNRPAYAPPTPQYLTLDDVVMKTAACLGVLGATAAVAWVFDLGALGIVGALVGFVLALIISFKQSTNPALILSYAAAEGVFLGGISRLFNDRWPGIVIQAVIGTGAVFGGMLVVYKTGAIRVTPRFTRWMLGALIGVVALMMVNLLAGLFNGGHGIGLRDANSPGIAIAFSILCIGIAAFTFLLDFDMIEKAIRQGAPERFAWYAAFGLVVGLVWLYLEILRLLSYFRD
ncbi:MAG TPA: Bax inhibitor-1/YccA family protein [Mycobacteriales bacterium]|nr:Bax inhibitor-1/YccA family protein [Mycobacteriales bacterium]